MQDWRFLREYVEHGSEAAFAQLVEVHLNLVYATCLREVRDPASAEDATQVVFLILARKASSIREGTNLAGWLFNTARFTSKNALKREARRRMHEQQAAEEAMTPDPQEDATWPRIEPILHAGLAQLSAGDREAVLLRFFQAQSLKDTGEALGISEDAARMRVTRAVEKLRRYFGKHGFAVTSVALAAMLSTRAVQAAPAQCLSRALAAGGASPALASTALGGQLHGALRALMFAKLKAAALVAVGAVFLAGGGGFMLHLAVSRPDPGQVAGSGTTGGSRNAPRLASSHVIGPTPRPIPAWAPAAAPHHSLARVVRLPPSPRRDLVFHWTPGEAVASTGGNHSVRRGRPRVQPPSTRTTALHPAPRAVPQRPTPGSGGPSADVARKGVAAAPDPVATTAVLPGPPDAASPPRATDAVAVAPPDAVPATLAPGTAKSKPAEGTRKSGKTKFGKIRPARPLHGRVVRVNESDSSITIKTGGRLDPAIEVADGAVISVDSQSSQLGSLRPGMKVIIQTGVGQKAESIVASTKASRANDIGRKFRNMERKLALGQLGPAKRSPPPPEQNKEVISGANGTAIGKSN